MVRRLCIGKNNHLTCYSLALNPRFSLIMCKLAAKATLSTHRGESPPEAHQMIKQRYGLDCAPHLGPLPQRPGRVHTPAQPYRSPTAAIAKIRERLRTRTAPPRYPPPPEMGPWQHHTPAQPKAKISNHNSKDFCLFVLRFYGPVNLMGSCWARSVYLSTHSQGRLNPPSG